MRSDMAESEDRTFSMVISNSPWCFVTVHSSHGVGDEGEFRAFSSSISLSLMLLHWCRHRHHQHRRHHAHHFSRTSIISTDTCSSITTTSTHTPPTPYHHLPPLPSLPAALSPPTAMPMIITNTTEPPPFSHQHHDQHHPLP